MELVMHPPWRIKKIVVKKKKKKQMLKLFFVFSGPDEEP